MNRDDITRREARKMVSMGMYDTVEEAWAEAEAVCEDSDSYEILEDIDYEDDNQEEEEYEDEDED